MRQDLPMLGILLIFQPCKNCQAKGERGGAVAFFTVGYWTWHHQQTYGTISKQTCCFFFFQIPARQHTTVLKVLYKRESSLTFTKCANRFCNGRVKWHQNGFHCPKPVCTQQWADPAMHTHLLQSVFTKAWDHSPAPFKSNSSASVQPCICGWEASLPTVLRQWTDFHCSASSALPSLDCEAIHTQWCQPQPTSSLQFLEKYCIWWCFDGGVEKLSCWGTLGFQRRTTCQRWCYPQTPIFSRHRGNVTLVEIGLQTTALGTANYLFRGGWIYFHFLLLTFPCSVLSQYRHFFSSHILNYFHCTPERCTALWFFPFWSLKFAENQKTVQANHTHKKICTKYWTVLISKYVLKTYNCFHFFSGTLPNGGV